MTFKVDDVFRQGGRDLLDLLEYCVLSINKDILFAFLAGEYRQRPTASAAAAMFDMFCAARAPARISVHALLPPKDMRLEQALRPYRRLQASPHEQATSRESDAPVFNLLPPRYLFDSLVQKIAVDPDGAIAELEQRYDPSLTPHENLPGGRLQAGQRAFVENIWLPVVRPQLVAAGFWRIATVA